MAVYVCGQGEKKTSRTKDKADTYSYRTSIVVACFRRQDLQKQNQQNPQLPRTIQYRTSKRAIKPSYFPSITNSDFVTEGPVIGSNYSDQLRAGGGTPQYSTNWQVDNKQNSMKRSASILSAVSRRSDSILQCGFPGFTRHNCCRTQLLYPHYRVRMSRTMTTTTTTPSILELEKQFPRQKLTLPNGAALSYVDVHPLHKNNDNDNDTGRDAPHRHTLLVVPGYACDSKYMAYTLAQYEAFRDHRILAVDPRGYGDSTFHHDDDEACCCWSHQDNAEDLKLFLDEYYLRSSTPTNNTKSNDSRLSSTKITQVEKNDMMDPEIDENNRVGNDGTSTTTTTTATHKDDDDYRHKIMVLGYSTGAGAAAWLALNYPKHISAVFMVRALPLNGMRTSLLSATTGKPTGDWLTTREEAIHYVDKILTPTIHSPNIQTFHKTIGATCLDPVKNLPVKTILDDRGFQIYHEAAMSHRSRAQALFANNAFNLTPIPTPIFMAQSSLSSSSSSSSLPPPTTTTATPPENVLQRLQCPMIIIHGAKDALIRTRQVRAVTDLALVERWAPSSPSGRLLYYEIPDCGHLFMYDNPTGFQTIYRQALETHVTTTKKKNENEKEEDLAGITTAGRDYSRSGYSRMRASL